MFPHLALATSAERTTFILSSVLLGKRTLSCNINGCPRRAQVAHAYCALLTSDIVDLKVDTDYCFRFTGHEKCEQIANDRLHLFQMKQMKKLRFKRFITCEGEDWAFFLIESGDFQNWFCKVPHLFDTREYK